jgi:hypothetical protein
VLTELKAYSSWESVSELLLSDTGRAETDLIQIVSIDGLEPVKAAVGVSAYGSVDGTAYTGSSILSRNIVLTLRPNPDWDTWTHEGLRRLLYLYFMPKRSIRLEFYSDDMPPVVIAGIVESIDDNRFSKDPEYVASVICPDPYFTTLEPIVLTGPTINPAPVLETIEIDYKGTVEAGIYVKAIAVEEPFPKTIGIQIGDPDISFFNVTTNAIDGIITTNKMFEMSSVPLQKFVQNVDLTTGVITSLLSGTQVKEGSDWPVLRPGINEFSVITDVGEHGWELRYFERFGGL